MQKETRISGHRACQLVGLSRMALHYGSKEQLVNMYLQVKLIGLAGECRRFGYRRLYALVQREGVLANYQWVYGFTAKRVLVVRRRRKRHGMAIERQMLEPSSELNQIWSMGFVSDALANGQQLKVLTIVADFSKGAVDLVADFVISGQYVARVLGQAARFRGYPREIRIDQGPEFRAINGRTNTVFSLR